MPLRPDDPGWAEGYRWSVTVGELVVGLHVSAREAEIDAATRARADSIRQARQDT